jgi:hypothetical protein
MPKDGKAVRLTGTQIRANHGIERVNSPCRCSEGRTGRNMLADNGHEY